MCLRVMIQLREPSHSHFAHFIPDLEQMDGVTQSQIFKKRAKRYARSQAQVN